MSSTGSSCLTVVGDVIVNSTYQPAVTIQKAGCYDPDSMQIVGSGTCSGSGCGSYVNRTSPVPDPLAGLPNARCRLAGVHRRQPFTRTRHLPHGALDLPQNGTTLAPGIYVMEAGVNFNNKADVHGTGVLLYNGCAAGFAAPNNGQISLTGNGDTALNLTPMTTGTYAGITIWQSAGNQPDVTLRGNGNISVGGIIYSAERDPVAGRWRERTRRRIDHRRSLSTSAATAPSSPARDGTAATRRAGERGETLVELILTITILGGAIVALVGGISDGILASDHHRKHSAAGALATNVSEYLLDSTVAWQANGVYGGLPTATGYTTSVAARCWNGTSVNPLVWGGCPNGDRGLQELTVTVTATDGNGAEKVTVLKRRPNGP